MHVPYVSGFFLALCGGVVFLLLLCLAFVCGLLLQTARGTDEVGGCLSTLVAYHVGIIDWLEIANGEGFKADARAT